MDSRRHVGDSSGLDSEKKGKGVGLRPQPHTPEDHDGARSSAQPAKQFMTPSAKAPSAGNYPTGGNPNMRSILAGKADIPSSWGDQKDWWKSKGWQDSDKDWDWDEKANKWKGKVDLDKPHQFCDSAPAASFRHGSSVQSSSSHFGAAAAQRSDDADKDSDVPPQKRPSEPSDTTHVWQFDNAKDNADGKTHPKWQNYDKDLLYKIWNRFHENPDKNLEINQKDWKVVINFLTMTQTNRETGSERTIRCVRKVNTEEWCPIPPEISFHQKTPEEKRLTQIEAYKAFKARIIAALEVMMRI